MDELRDALRDCIEGFDGFDGACALAVEDLATGRRTGIDGDSLMATASVIKVPVLVTLYRKVDAGELSLATRLRSPEERVIGSGVLNKLDTGVELSLRDAAVLMIIISDNVATNMVVDAVGGPDAVTATLRELGLPRSTMFLRLGDGSRGLDGRKHYVMSPNESVSLLAMIFRGQAASSESCADMLRILRRQQHREKLARDLPWNELNTLPDPKTEWVAGKGGTYIHGVRNDTGIFHRGGRAAALAVFTSGAEDRAGPDHVANRMLGRIGRVVWDWLAPK